MEQYYKYIGDLDSDFQEELKDTFENAVINFNIQNPHDGYSLAKQTRQIVDDILESGKYPEYYEDLADATVALGVLFGQALCTGFGWKWKAVGESSEDFFVSVVSPEEYFCNMPLHYMNRIMSGNNIGLDGENDNTVLLLYNMLRDADKNPKDKKLYPLS